MRSSSNSSKSLRSAAPMGEIAKSSMTSRSSLASCVSRRAKLPSPCATCSSSNSLCSAHVQHREAAACGLMRQGTSQPRLAAAGGTRDEQIARMTQPVATGQRGDEPAIQPAAGAPVDVLDAGRADLELGRLEQAVATRRSSRQATSRCTSSVSRSSKLRPAAAVLVACSSMARTMPSRRRLRSWSRVCSFNMG
jgi:hypothetical protein